MKWNRELNKSFNLHMYFTWAKFTMEVFIDVHDPPRRKFCSTANHFYRIFVRTK